MNDFNVRDLFAALAMCGLMASDTKQEFGDATIASMAYDQADEMIKEKEKRDGGKFEA